MVRGSKWTFVAGTYPWVADIPILGDYAYHRHFRQLQPVQYGDIWLKQPNVFSSKIIVGNKQSNPLSDSPMIRIPHVLSKPTCSECTTMMPSSGPNSIFLSTFLSQIPFTVNKKKILILYDNDYDPVVKQCPEIRGLRLRASSFLFANRSPWALWLC